MAEELGNSLARWPRGYGYLADQSRRVIASVVLNLAEGNAKRSPLDRKRFFQIASGSMAEVGACLDLMRVFHLITETQSQHWKGISVEVCKMLYALR